MLDRQNIFEAQERYGILARLDDLGLLDEPDLQKLMQEQKRVTLRLLREQMEAQLKVIS